MMAKFGPRKWLTRIMFTWGIIAGLTAFCGNAKGLYALRFLLGVAEAGFFPGLVLYITYWFRTEDHAQAVSWLFIGSVVGIIIGGPLSGWLLGWKALGFRGWQWLFIVEGLMPVIYAFLLWFYLPDTPEKAKWLKPEQKEWLTKVIAAENALKETPKHITVVQGPDEARHPCSFFLVYFLTGIGYLGQQLWMPQLFKSVGKNLSSMQIGILTMLPALCTLVTLIFWSRHSDKTGERHWHFCIAAYVAACGLLLYLFSANRISRCRARYLHRRARGRRAPSHFLDGCDPASGQEGGCGRLCPHQLGFGFGRLRGTVRDRNCPGDFRQLRGCHDPARFRAM